jgi:hypothetical protein
MKKIMSAVLLVSFAGLVGLIIFGAPEGTVALLS